MNKNLWQQAWNYGAQVRSSSGSRSNLSAALRKPTNSEAREYNDAVVQGWEARDAEIKAAKERAR